MKAWRLLPFLLCTPLAEAQTPMDMASAPHYRLLLANDQVRVFAVTLKPTERTLARHDHNFSVITLQDCEVVMWPEGASDILGFRFNQGDVRFFFGGRAIGIRNDRNSQYRNVTVEFLDPKVTSYGYQADKGTWDYGAAAVNPPVDPHASFKNTLSLADATLNDVQLLSRNPLPTPEKDSPQLLIPVSDIDLKAGESERIRKSSGEAVWIQAGSTSRFINAAGDPARLVVIEFKTRAAR
ncbi:MAG TPA: hypothetical protein VK513_00730 [Terriglobales bacterium]|nr:hypothetical protein [Terriglobales bacterium]